MLESTFLFIGLTALLLTLTGFALALVMQEDSVVIIVGIAGSIAWGMTAYGALDIRVVGDSVTYSFTQPAVAVFALMMSLPSLYLALTGPIEVVNQFRDVDQRNL